LKYNSYCRNSDDLSTPEWVYSFIVENITQKIYNFEPKIDVCSQEWSKKCSMHYDETVDGLKTTWALDIWCNPPYSKPGVWLDKYVRSMFNFDINGVFLLKADFTTKWFQGCCTYGDIYLFPERIKFLDSPKTLAKDSGTFPNMIVVFKPKIYASKLEDEYPTPKIAYIPKPLVIDFKQKWVEKYERLY
jgi:phage N-6-adenine-methyltransferase